MGDKLYLEAIKLIGASRKNIEKIEDGLQWCNDFLDNLEITLGKKYGNLDYKCYWFGGTSYTGFHRLDGNHHFNVFPKEAKVRQA